MNPTERQRVWLPTGVYFICFVLLGLSAAVLGPSLPSLADNTSSQIAQISLLFATQSMGYLLGAAGSGWWLDRRPAHPLLALMLLTIASCLFLTPWMTHLALLAGLMFIMGIAMATIDTSGNALLVWVHRQNVGPKMNALHFFFGVGSLLSPLLVAQSIFRTGSLHWAFLCLAVFMVPLSFVLMRLPSPSPRPLQNSTSGQTSRPVLVLLVVLMFFTYVGVEGSFGGWIFTYAREMNMTTVLQAGLLTSLFWASLTLGRLLGIPLATRFQTTRLLVVDFAGMITCLTMMVMNPDSVTLLWLATAGFGLANASVFPLMMTLAEERLSLTGKMTGWFVVGASVGAMTIPFVIGQLFSQFGPPIVIWILLACTITCLIFYLLFLGASQRLA